MKGSVYSSSTLRSLLLLSVLSLAACAKQQGNVKEASVEDIAAWLKAGTATVFDANTESFRKQNGVVAGAVLLDKYNAYDLSVLGTDKSRQLVFYCTNRL